MPGMAQSWLLGACLVMAVTLAVVLSLLPATKPATEHVLMSAVGAVYRAFAPAPPERLPVEAVTANLPRYHGRRIQLHGIARSVDSADGTARFQLQDGTATMRVLYEGPWYDRFSEGSRIVVEGIVSGDELRSHRILLPAR
jgi:cytochrome c-type biogenesis protein CcmE